MKRKTKILSKGLELESPKDSDLNITDGELEERPLRDRLPDLLAQKVLAHIKTNPHAKDIEKSIHYGLFILDDIDAPATDIQKDLWRDSLQQRLATGISKLRARAAYEEVTGTMNALNKIGFGLDEYTKEELRDAVAANICKDVQCAENAREAHIEASWMLRTLDAADIALDEEFSNALKSAIHANADLLAKRDGPKSKASEITRQWERASLARLEHGENGRPGQLSRDQEHDSRQASLDNSHHLKP